MRSTSPSISWPGWRCSESSADARGDGPPAGRSRSLGPDGPVLAALAVALLWVLHPLQTESITYIVQRAESLMGLFYLLTLYCFIRHAEGDQSSASPSPDGKRWAGLAIACCFLGMASKEVMVSAPLIVFLYDRTFVSGSFRKAWQQHRGLYIGLASSWLLLAFWPSARTPAAIPSDSGWA